MAKTRVSEQAVLAPNLVVRMNEDGTMTAADLVTAAMFRFEGLTAEVLKILVEGQSLDAGVKALSKKHDIAVEDLEKEVTNFLQFLKQKELVTAGA